MTVFNGSVTNYDLFIGIDYSGAETATARLKSLQVYAGTTGGIPTKQVSPMKRQDGSAAYWSRAEIARWLIDLAKEGRRFIAGIDHVFSFPLDYFTRYKLDSWPQFLEDFVRHWPTDQSYVYVDFVREGDIANIPSWPGPGLRIGRPTELRLCEQWTSSAKSVFQFDCQGSVAKSSHAGIPWLKRIRDAVGDRVHFWPFDGWVPVEGKAVIAEVYPSIFRRRYAGEARLADEHDAYSISAWMLERHASGVLTTYFSPPLTPAQQEQANREGWILGVM